MDNDSAKAVGWLAGMGCAVGLSHLIASKEKLTARIILGRALSSAGLGAASAVILAWFPDMPLAAMLGASATVSSLGTSAIEKLLQRLVGRSS